MLFLITYICPEFSTRFLVNGIIMSTVTIRLAHEDLAQNRREYFAVKFASFETR